MQFLEMEPYAALRLSGAIEITAQSGEGQSILSRPKQVALLAILACDRERFVRRDALLPVLWSELSQERARAALRKTVFAIRRDLGLESIVNRGSEEIGLGPAVRSDVAQFHEFLDAGDAERALDEYGGELLPAFHLSGEPEFERWLEQERERLATAARRALLAGLERARELGDVSRAERMVERAMRFHPDDELLLRKSMLALRSSGNAPAAMRTYERYRARLRRDLQSEPGAATERLAEELRAELVAAHAHRETETSAIEREARVPASDSRGDQPDVVRRADEGATEVTSPGHGSSAMANDVGPRETTPPATRLAGRRRTWKRIGALAGVLALALVSVSALNVFRPPASAADETGLPTLAVAGIESYLPNDTGRAAALSDMLATSLARIPGLPVVSTLRMYEASAGDASPVALANAARRVGAQQVFEGGLHTGAEGRLRLELRRVDLASGTVLDTYRVEASTPLDAVNRATLQVANSLGLPVPSSSRRSATTESMRAHEFYEQGLRAWYGGRQDAARDLFRQAVAEDSTFAVATWMLATSLAWQPGWIETYDRAVRHAERATERERLMINASYLAAMEAPERREAAESLLTRYPQEPMGHQLMGEALVAEGRPLEAIPHLRRVLELDTLGLLEISPTCLACEAFWHLGAAYFAADSMDAGLRTWEAWSRAAPGSAAPWSWLAYGYEARERYDDAEEALRRMQVLEPESGSFHVRLAALRLHANRLEEADSILQARIRVGSAEERREASWNLALLRMNQGRFREALAYADSYRATAPEGSRMSDAYLRGTVLLNSGDGNAAAALFDSIAAQPVEYTLQSRRGREMAMNRTNYADALAMAGNVRHLRALEDSVREWGSLSGFMRDRIIHHHVRGLRLRAEGRLQEAAEEFSRAQFGPRSAGYARTNLELARTLLALGRPQDALEVLRLNIFASIGADQLWASRTEAREMLGIAHEALGNADSARVHYESVLAAWRRADPVLGLRRQALQESLRRLGS